MDMTEARLECLKLAFASTPPDKALAVAAEMAEFVARARAPSHVQALLVSLQNPLPVGFNDGRTAEDVSFILVECDAEK